MGGVGGNAVGVELGVAVGVELGGGVGTAVGVELLLGVGLLGEVYPFEFRGQ